MPCQHAVAVHTLNPLAPFLHSTCDEEEDLKTRQVMLTGVEESQGLTFPRCDIIVISKDADPCIRLCAHHEEYFKNRSTFLNADDLL